MTAAVKQRDDGKHIAECAEHGDVSPFGSSWPNVAQGHADRHNLAEHTKKKARFT